MAAELQDQFGIESELVAASGGVFEITVDGKAVFSKKTLGRFPEDGEVARAIRAL